MITEQTDKPDINSPETITDAMREVKMVTILAAVENGANITEACKGVVISRETFYQWFRKYEDFRIGILNNKKIAVKMMESALFNSGVNGDFQAQRFFLVNMAPDEWKNMRNINLSGGVEIATAKDILSDLAGMKKVTKNEGGTETQ